MAEYLFKAGETLQLLAGIPVLLMGLYVYKSKPKDVSNRVFAVMCTLWTTFIIAVNLVFMSADQDTADMWNQFYVYTQLAFFPSLIHFVLVFPYHSRILKHKWLVPGLYLLAAGAIVAAISRPGLIILEATPYVDGTFLPNYRPIMVAAFQWSFTIAVLLLLIRYVTMDLDVTRKRLYFVTFALSTYALYSAVQDFHTNASESYKSQFVGRDVDVWQMTLAADYLLLISTFGLLGLLALRSTIRERRRDAAMLMLACGLAVVTGYFDPIVKTAVWRDYPETLWLWRFFAVGLMFYAILRYQLFDLHVRIRVGIKYGTLSTLFGFVFFTVQELVKDKGGDALGYFVGLVCAAGLTFLATPVQRLIERFSTKVVPPSSTENYEKYRAMEIYRAALEGALADQIVSPAESHALKNLRTKLGITDGDHVLLERDIRGIGEQTKP